MTKHFLRLITSALFLLSTSGAYGGELTFTKRMEAVLGSPIAVNDKDSVQVSPVSDPDFTDLSLENYLTLMVNPNHPVLVSSSQQTSVVVQVTPYNSSLVALTPFTVTLTVKYDPNQSSVAYTDRHTYKFTTGYYKFKFKIQSITVNGSSSSTLPRYLAVEGKATVGRFYDFSSVVNTPLTVNTPDASDIDCDTASTLDELTLSWQPFGGTVQADEYQLEWTFVNNYNSDTVTDTLGLNKIAFDFRNNSTRVTTTNTYYKIPLVFDRGFVIYRIRAVGYDPSAPSTPMFSEWNLAESGTLTSGGITSDNYYYVTTPHEGNKNWQITTTFAEEGKKKEVVSYFDGSLRNRQTVTRINSDNHTIVGETIYDYQGRPAVTVLPVPVPDPACLLPGGTISAALKYYPKFNIDSTSTAYSKLDFDTDADTASCNILAPEMDTLSGASRYYSPYNPDKFKQQAFVPDAKGYPFTQVEYTPDNTGRIRRQGGVGPEFQLFGGHDTRYFYGQPNQIQMDRLFGSEVGDAAHYKKNVVIDPNGQASVSYLDQEGRVIATALAGDSTSNLHALPSSKNYSGTSLTADLFNKNALGESLSNTVTANGDGINFSTELLVAYQSNYSFNYEINIDTLYDTCLKENVCLSCVYDLNIQVLDECGVNLVEAGGDTLSGLVGKFELDSAGNLSFDPSCHSPSEYDSTMSFTLNLSPGNYTVIKTLTLNHAWRDSVVAAYIDTAYNHCVLSLQDFIDAEMANIDTSGCAIDCEECLASLGTRDDFVASGKGTALQYDILAEQCQAPCKSQSLCQTIYQQMLMDVSPKGQYAQYDLTSSTSISVSAYPLSIFNSLNHLPNNVPIPSSIYDRACWRNPVTVINGHDYPFYFEEDGSKSIVKVISDGAGGYFPPVYYSDSVKTDPVTGDQYIYPQLLLRETDFITFFKTSWAPALVKYHPEYCYYETCNGYESKPTATDHYSSEEFDELLRSAETFQDAIDKGLIDSGTKLPTNWFDSTATHPYDPFVTYGYGTFGNELSTKYSQFVDYGAGFYTMVQQAAIMARCNVPGAAPSLSCMAFGTDYVIGDPTQNTQIRDKEWGFLRDFYLSSKQVIQNSRADDIALKDCIAFNDCIGNDNISSYMPIMSANIVDVDTAYLWPAWAGPSIFIYDPVFYVTTSFTDIHQPCSEFNRTLYLHKQKRFIDQYDIPGANTSDPMQAAYQLYLQTGQCPVTHNLEGMLSIMADSTELTDTLRLIDVPGYAGLYLAINGYAPTMPITDYDFTWMPDTSLGTTADTLFVTVASADDTCHFHFDKTGSGITDWDDIIGFSTMVSTGYTAPDYSFTVNAHLPTSDSSHLYTLVEITGYTSCYKIDDCDFPLSCEPTQLGYDIYTLMNFIANNGDLDSSGTLLDSLPYSGFLTPAIYGAMGLSSNTGLQWKWDVGENAFEIVNPSTPSQVLKVKCTDYIVGYLSGIFVFSNFTSNGLNYFSVDAADTSGASYGTFHFSAYYTDGSDSTGLKIAVCDQPEALTCAQNPAAHNEEMLSDLVKNLLLHQPFDSTLAAATSPAFTEAFADLLAYPVTPLNNHYHYSFTSPREETWSISLDSTCSIDFRHVSYTTPDTVDLNDLTSLQGIFPYGDADEDGMFHDFYLIGHFSNPTSVDTIFGTSCIGFQPCIECTDTSLYPDIIINDTLDSIPNAMGLYMPGDFKSIASGKMAKNQKVLDYLEYKAAVTAYNEEQKHHKSMQVKVANLAQYQRENLRQVQQPYLRYLKQHTKGQEKYGTAPKSISHYTKDLFAGHTAGTSGLSVYQTGISPGQLLSHEYGPERAGEGTVLLHPGTATSFAPGGGMEMRSVDLSGSTPESDSCYSLYLQYVTAYFNWFDYQINHSGTCPDTFYINTPMQTYDDFVAKNYCCNSNTGFDAFADYIATFDTLTNCPGNVDTLTACTDSADLGLYDKCGLYYLQYVDLIMNYDTCAYALANNHVLTPMDYDSFVNSPKCDCSKPYQAYLNNYIYDTAPYTEPLPLPLSEYTNCYNYPPNECDNAYDTYLLEVDIYNAWADTNINNPPIIGIVLTDSAFVVNGFCYCVEQYIAALHNAEDGLIDPSTSGFINLLRRPTTVCDNWLAVPCAPNNAPADTLPSIPYPNYVNPCVQYQLDMAVVNATNAYNQYIDSLTTYIANKYTQHCLNALETFTDTYLDKEYHFTLYYYDQAGNLVKTVPPQGVEIVNITSPSSTDEVKCISDRTYGTQQVFTNHTLATRYEYNSLNQLVKQTMPDHDNMNIWETALPNGLDSNLTVTSVQFVNESKGYLTGTLPGGYQSTRGLLYTTSDAGATWQKVNIAATDFKKIQMIDTLYGYAAGNNGMAFITIDGGNTWDPLSDYHEGITSVSPVYTFYDINDLAFKDRDHGVLIMDNGAHISVNPAVSDGTITNTGFSRFFVNGSADSNDINTSVALDSILEYKMTQTRLDSLTGLEYTQNYRLTGSGSSYAGIGSLTSENINNISFIDTLKAYACGADGGLIYTANKGANWFYVHNSLQGVFKDVHFRDETNGLALVENSSGTGQLWATHDRGLTWEILSDPAKDYNAMSPYEVSSTATKLVAVGDNGVVSRVLLVDGTDYGMIDLDVPSATADFTTCWGTLVDNKPWLYVAGTGSNIFYKTTDGGASTVTWVSDTITTITGFKKIAAQNFADNTINPTINGTVLANDNKLYKFYKPLGNYQITVFSLITIGTPPAGITATTAFNDVVVQNGKLYAVNNTTEQHIYYSAVTSAGAVGSVAYATRNVNTTGAHYPITAANQLQLSSSDKTLITVGTSGRFEQATISGATTFTWLASSSEPSGKVKSLPMTASDTYGSTTIAVGQYGQLQSYYFFSSTSTHYAKLFTTGFKKTINELQLTSKTTGYAVCDSGQVYPFTLNLTTRVATFGSVIHAPTTDNLNDLAVKGDTAYIVGDNGKVWYSSDLSAGAMTAATNLTNGKINAVEFIPGTLTAIAAGENAHAQWCAGTNAMKNRNFYQFPLNKVHFRNSSEGYVVGNRYTIKHTVDGGANWITVTPEFTTGPTSHTTHDFQSVKMLTKNYAVAVGTREFIELVANNTGKNRLNAETTKTFYDVDFATPTRGYTVGVNSTSGYFKALDFDTTTKVLSINTGITINSTHLTSRPLYTIQAFDGSLGVAFAAWGKGTSFVWHNGSGSSSTSVTVSGFSSTTAIRDAYFHDNKMGYIVGDDGVIRKNTDFITSKGSFVTETDNDSLNHQYLTTDMDIKAIAFSSRYKGFMGGLYNGTDTTTNNENHNYARTIRDESGYYSTFFYYDKLGRIVVSQNTRQYNASPVVPGKKYSYTLYDALGRVVEAGEKTENAYGSSHLKFTNVPGTVVNNFFSPTTIDNDSLLVWINDSTGARKEVTMSFYDEPVAAIASTFPGSFAQENLRKRIATVMYEEEYDYDTTTYTHATHYTYDIHGNVKTLVQDNKNVAASEYGAAVAAEQFKRIDYDYDLISGNVNEVSYQKDSVDQWRHRYSYDADNRIIEVETSDNGVQWDNDASYFYYAHGPLARTELGNDKVQGLDHAYTLQGWIKGVNSNQLTVEQDMGGDGLIASSNTNQLFGKDIAGYTLNYFNGDYRPIDYSGKWNTVTNRFESDKTGSDLLGARYDLFNGNIGAMVTTITDTAGNVLPQGTAYQYDQLNRIIQSKAYTNLNTGTNTWQSGSTYANRYFNKFTYDANGNILTQVRHRQDGTKIENLSYGYHTSGGKTLQNRLYHVDDDVLVTIAADDIDDMGTMDTVNYNTANNYQYDEEGRLKRDISEGIEEIVWRVDGKVKEVRRYSGSQRKNLKFEYDAMGQRIAKHIYSSSNVWEKSTYYVRDAQGNVLATYDKVDQDSTMSYKLTERDIYGSSRLGLNTRDVEMIGATVDTANYYHSLGYKQYEVSNHLGNVLAVVTDKKYPHDLGDYDGDNDSTNTGYVSGTLDGIVDLYTADLVLSRDYSPFGVTLDGRSFTRQTCDTLTVIDTIASLDETWPTTSVDGWQKIDAADALQVLSGELRINGSGVLGMYTLTTLEHANYIIIKATMRRSSASGTAYGRIRLVDTSTNTVVWKDSVVVGTTNVNYSSGIGIIPGGVYRFEFERINTTATSFYLDNVLLAYADTNTVVDCDGGRKDYRYAFNGMEHDDEVKGETNSYDFGARIYDSRLGRFLSVDPFHMSMRSLSPYSFAANSPIAMRDKDGHKPELSMLWGLLTSFASFVTAGELELWIDGKYGMAETFGVAQWTAGGLAFTTMCVAAFMNAPAAVIILAPVVVAGVAVLAFKAVTFVRDVIIDWKISRNLRKNKVTLENIENCISNNISQIHTIHKQIKSLNEEIDVMTKEKEDIQTEANSLYVERVYLEKKEHALTEEQMDLLSLPLATKGVTAKDEELQKEILKIRERRKEVNLKLLEQKNKKYAVESAIINRQNQIKEIEKGIAPLEKENKNLEQEKTAVKHQGIKRLQD